VLVYLILISDARYHERKTSWFLFFYSNFYYLLSVGVDGYCCTWSHTRTR